MSWPEVDAWRDDQERALRRNATHQLSMTETHVWHARTKQRAWLYLTKAGELREWLQHQLSHAHNLERVSMVALCTEETGELLPAINGNVANHLTQKFDRITCPTCRVLFDTALEAGRVDVDQRSQRFHFRLR